MKLYQCVLANVLFSAIAVSADSPHFVTGFTTVSCYQGDLLVCFREVGFVERFPFIPYSLSALAVADSTCANPAGRPVPGLRSSSQTIVSVLQRLGSPLLNEVSGCISAPSSNCIATPRKCPPALNSVYICRYNNIVLTDTTNGITLPVGDIICS